MACKLMALHASSRHALEIQFEGESGFGSGVTQNFYSATANELLKVGVNQALPVWICDLPAGQHADSTIVHHGELFPLPLTARMPAARQAGLRALPLPRPPHGEGVPRLVHRATPPLQALLAARARRDAHLLCAASPGRDGRRRERLRRRVPAPVGDRRRGRDAGRGGAAAEVRARGGPRVRLVVPRHGHAPLPREWLQAGGCAFVCPLTGEPLCEGGEERELTVHNLQEYVHLLSQLWLADGVIAQAAAFREGLEEVFPLETLALFTVSELQTVLCGTMSIEWTEAELQRHLHPSGGYTKHSKVYQFLIDELQRMGNETRAKFLNFVTACPHLPPVGLSMLEIEVLPQHSGSAFPTAQTCGNKLYLPEYDTAEELRGGLAEAFANTEAGGLHEHAG